MKKVINTFPRLIRVLVAVEILLFVGASAVTLNAGNAQDATGPEWPMTRGNAARTGAVEDPGISAPLAPVWTFSHRPDMPLMGPPIVASETVFVSGGYDEPVFALDVSTGAVRWQADLGDVGGDLGMVGLAAADGMLFAAGSEGPESYDSGSDAALYALDVQTGQERWRHSFREPLIQSAPVVDGGTVFLTITGSSEADRVMAFDAATGAVQWSFSVDEVYSITSDPAVVEGVLYVAAFEPGFDNGFVYALDAATGTERWRGAFAGYPDGGPVVSSGVVLLQTSDFESPDGRLIALDSQSGAQLWETESGGQQTRLIASADTAYLGFSEPQMGGVYEAWTRAIDLKTGSERWRVDGLSGSGVMTGTTVFAATVTQDPYPRISGIVALDGTTGAELWRAEAKVGVAAAAYGVLFGLGQEGPVAFGPWTGEGEPPPAIVVSTGAEGTLPEEPLDDAIIVDEEYEPAPEEILDDAVIADEVPIGEDPFGPAIYRASADGTGVFELAPGAMPSWSPDGTRIVFEYWGGIDADIAVINADGTGLVTVVQLPGWDTAPVWSPDGSKIAFTNGNGGALYVVNADGSGLMKLVEFGVGMSMWGFNQRPSWSPDGTKLAFAAELEGNGNEIWVVNVDGSGMTRLTDEPAATPVADGVPFELAVTVVFCPEERPSGERPWDALPEGDPAPYLDRGCRLAGAGEVRLTLDGWRQSAMMPWPLAEATTGTDGVARLAGNLFAERSYYLLAEHGPEAFGQEKLFDPLPSSFLFVNYALPQEMLAGGEEPVDADFGYDPVDEFEQQALAPAWSPDGTTIAYVLLRPDGEGGVGSGGLWVMNLDGSGKRQLTDVVPDETQPVWSAGGTKLYFASRWQEEAMPDIYVIEVNGGAAVNLTNTPESPEFWPAPFMDGSRILCAGLGPGGLDVMLLLPDGTMTPLIAGELEESNATWSPDGQYILYQAMPYVESSD